MKCKINLFYGINIKIYIKTGRVFSFPHRKGVPLVTLRSEGRRQGIVLFWRNSAPIECGGGTGHPVYRVLAVKDHQNLEIDTPQPLGQSVAATKRFRCDLSPGAVLAGFTR